MRFRGFVSCDFVVNSQRALAYRHPDPATGAFALGDPISFYSTTAHDKAAHAGTKQHQRQKKCSTVEVVLGAKRVNQRAVRRRRGRREVASLL